MEEVKPDEQLEKQKDEAFIEAVKELAKQHKRDLAVRLSYTPTGIKPEIYLIRSQESK